MDKLSLHGLTQYYIKLDEGQKTRKLTDLMDILGEMMTFCFTALIPFCCLKVNFTSGWWIRVQPSSDLRSRQEALRYVEQDPPGEQVSFHRAPFRHASGRPVRQMLAHLLACVFLVAVFVGFQDDEPDSR